MCGIAGYVGVDQPGLLEAMCAAVTHRGPDSGGEVALPNRRIGIGMRRLAVIDLHSGDQPMSAADGQVQLVFNGEIYNFRELRGALQALGHVFRTESDTEVILAAYLEWGRAAWQRLHGMFAIAIADTRGPTPLLKVVRDRVGIKPLYFILAQHRFLFASEIKALQKWDAFDKTVDLDAISRYLALRYVPGPGTMFQQVRKVPPAHELTFVEGQLHVFRYWEPPDTKLQDSGRKAEDAVADFGQAVRTSVHRHMISDVPVGAFLSGGIDSSLIVALMAQMTSEPIRTFSVGFAGQSNEDLRGAATTAKAIGARHTEIECGVQDFLSLPDIAWSLDEPVGDPIVVPMFALAREARKDVTVVLSGEGADELLGGYVFHRRLVQLDRARRFLPSFCWRSAARIVERIPPAIVDRAFDYPGKLGRSGRGKIARLLRDVSRSELAALYRSSITLFDPEDLRDAGTGRMHPAETSMEAPEAGTTLQRLIALQYSHWLPDDILMKSDKLTMAHSLECRVPFLDDLVIQAAARCADDVKLRGGVNKWVLREFGREVLPNDIANVPKRAFYAPFTPYLRDPAFAEILRHALDPTRLRRRGLLDPAYVERLVAQGLQDGFLPEKRLFAILMLELWFDRFVPDASWN